MSKSTVKIGIIGCGAIAKQYHMPALKDLEGCNVTAVCDLIPERAKEAGNYFGLDESACFTDAKEMLTQSDVQGVLILTPNYCHCELTELAAGFHKHIFVTKPMGRNVEECRRMISACEKNRVQLFVSFMHRYLLGIEQVRNLLRDNYIGKVEMVRILNAPGATSTVSKWFYNKENVGGGCVIDIGVHGIDLVRYLLGEIHEISSARLGRFRDKIFTQGEYVFPDNEDHALAVYTTCSGAVVNHMISWHHWSSADRFSMELFGTEGSVFLRESMGIVNVCRVRQGQPAKWVSLQVPYRKLGEEQHEKFIEMIRTGSKADPDGYEGLACIRVAGAIYRSAELGKPVLVRESD